MRMLVTGGAGFIGSHLCGRLLEDNHDVWCLDNLHLGSEANIDHLKANPRFRFCKADILHRQELEHVFSDSTPDIVCHLAANSDIAAGNADRELDLRLNFLTTIEVLEAMRRHCVTRVLFASTSAVFGETSETLHEDTGRLRPASFYGASKLAAEAWLSVYRQQFGFRAWVVRFPNVVGERMTHGAVHDFMAKLRRDPSRLDVLGDGTQTKPYLYAGDLVQAILLVMYLADETFAVYHVAGEGLTSVRQIAEITVEEMGLKDTAILYGRGSYGWPGDVPHFHYDSSKIKALGFVHRYDSTSAVRVAIRRSLGKDAPCKS